VKYVTGVPVQPELNSLRMTPHTFTSLDELYLAASWIGVAEFVILGVAGLCLWLWATKKTFGHL